MVNYYKLFFSFCIVVFSGSLFAQTEDDLKKMMDSLENMAKQFELQMKSGALDKPSNTISAEKKGQLNKLPELNAKLISQINVFNTADIQSFYKKSAKGFYDAAFKDEEDQKKNFDTIFLSASNADLNELAMKAYLNTQYDISILYLLKILEKNPNNTRAASNLGAVCIAAGLPHKSVSILEYYIKTNPEDPSLLNNCGQAYLSMGELGKAKQYLEKALLKANWHPEANAALAWIYASGGNKAKAISHAKNSLKSAYNTTAISVLREVVSDEEEFYAILPVPDISLYPASRDLITVTEVPFPLSCTQVGAYQKAVEEARKPYEEMLIKLNKALENKVGGGDVGKFMELMKGSVSESLKDQKFSRKQKGQLLLKKAERDYVKKIEVLQQDLSDFIMRESELMSRESEAIAERCKNSSDVPRCRCRENARINNAYLQKLKPQYQSYKNGYWAATTEYCRVMEYWEPALNGNNTMFEGELEGYSRKTVLLTAAMQLSGWDLGGMSCCDVSGLGSAPAPNIDFANGCVGINFTIPLHFGEISISCDKVKVKGGEGLVLGYEYEFKSGQSTFMAGPGVQLHEGLVNVSVAALGYVTLDSDGNYVDIGVKATAEASAMKVGPLNYLGAETELSLGLESGPSYETSGKVMNQEAISWKG